jgi:hypothetical protein
MPRIYSYINSRVFKEFGFNNKDNARGKGFVARVNVNDEEYY